MSTVTVVHLSDLHISTKASAASASIRTQLLDDLTKLVSREVLTVDAIAVTGDLIDRGARDGYDTAGEFLQLALERLGLGSERLMCVPGNHDVPRRPAVATLMGTWEFDDFDSLEKAGQSWEVLSTRFTGYESFLTRTANVSSWLPSEFLSYVAHVNIGEVTVRFILLNSAWSTCGKDDYGHVRIGKRQLDSVADLCREAGPTDLSLALMHHPEDWLDPDEMRVLSAYLTRSDQIGADAILHGHSHAGSIIHRGDPDGVLLSLTSGIGYSESGQRQPGLPKLDLCRYAVYRFDTVARTLEVWLRTSREDGAFVADTSLYSRGGEDGHFTIQYGMWAKPAASTSPETEQDHYVEADAVPTAPDWVGRESEMRQLLNPGIRLACITGIGGQGKTALAAMFMRRNSCQIGTAFEMGLWANCRELPYSLHVKIMELLEGLTAGVESSVRFKDEKPEETAKRLLSHLRKRRLLIVLDNVDAYINADTEGPTQELRPFLDAILAADHSSMVIMTSRHALSDPSAAFLHIPLKGLPKSDAVDLFRKRGIPVDTQEELLLCRELAGLTDGHPWWLGLLGGQILSGRLTLARCIDSVRRSDLTSARAADYFAGMWDGLESRLQICLRYLAAAPRPMSLSEMCEMIPHYSRKKAQKVARKLEGLGLVELHNTERRVTAYEVHPLVRQVVHEKYSLSAQRPIVARLLRVFLPGSYVSVLFSQDQKLPNQELPLLQNIVYSVETCLNSRYTVPALRLLERFMIPLLDDGFHHQFLSLGSRVVEESDWDDGRITESPLLPELIKLLCAMDQKRAASLLLNRYEAKVEAGTVSYLAYLSISAYAAWFWGEHERSLSLANRHRALAERLGRSSGGDVDVVRALALRDSGRFEQALSLFEAAAAGDSTLRSSDNLGNTARCLMGLGRGSDAERLLRQSLLLLIGEKNRTARENEGYAYQWIAEVMLATGRPREAGAFLLLARHAWDEYAPALLPRLTSLHVAIAEREEIGAITMEDALAIRDTFLGA